MKLFKQVRILFLAVWSLLFASGCSSLEPLPPSNSLRTPAYDAAGVVTSPRDGQDSATSPAARDHSTVSFGIGRRQLDEDYWLPVDEPMALDFEYSHELAGQVIGFEVGFALALAAEDEFVPPVGDIDFTNAQFELWGGVRKTFLHDSVARPYVGLGLVMLAVELEGESGGVSVDDDDWAAGGYAHAGVQFALGEKYLLALDLRIVRGTDVELFDVSGDVDYEQLALRFGLRL